jgi:hypothetical protein
MSEGGDPRRNDTVEDRREGAGADRAAAEEERIIAEQMRDPAETAHAALEQARAAAVEARAAREEAHEAHEKGGGAAARRAAAQRGRAAADRGRCRAPGDQNGGPGGIAATVGRTDPPERPSQACTKRSTPAPVTNSGAGGPGIDGGSGTRAAAPVAARRGRRRVLVPPLVRFGTARFGASSNGEPGWA